LHRCGRCRQKADRNWISRLTPMVMPSLASCGQRESIRADRAAA
jgi:hypothetical protein